MKNKKKGFTMVELVVVIAVIGILAAVLIPTFSNITEKANKSAALQEAGNALTVVLTEENAELKTEQFDYYFFSGDYVYKYVDGKLTALTKSEMTSLKFTLTKGDEIYAKDAGKYVMDEFSDILEKYEYYTDVVETPDDPATPESELVYEKATVYTVGAAKNGNVDMTFANSSDPKEAKDADNKINVREIADMGGVVVWKDAKVSA